jgi:PhzF family phenazine biosynthesis protein
VEIVTVGPSRPAGARRRESANTDLEVRSVAPGDGIPEDPVCGSGDGCVAALVRRDGILNTRSYVASQGRCLGRNGLVSVQFEDGTIWLGGYAVTCIEGVLHT